MVRSYKRGNTGGDEDISIQNLRDHFMVKFCDSDVYREAIDERYSHLRHTLSDNVMSESMMNRYIVRLRLGCAPGLDGIMGEHLRHAMGTPVINHLSISCSLYV
jgi:hypothetical protein